MAKSIPRNLPLLLQGKNPSVIAILPYSSPYSVASLLFALCSSISIGQFAAALEPISLPGCPSTCGNLTIPYPFGIGKDCARRGFHLTCNTSTEATQVFLGDGTVEALNISLQGQVRAGYHLAYDCYEEDGSRKNSSAWAFAGEGYPYTFSNLKNKFTVVGCDNYAYILGTNSSGFTGGCMSICIGPDAIVDGACSGIGCCQTAIPKGLKDYSIELGSYYNHSKVLGFNPCSYAFLADLAWFTFKMEDLSKDSRYRQMTRVPLVLDWVAGSESCDAARKDPANFACRSQNSDCYDSNSSATGYLCNCLTGYEGNPYLKGGCRDIDECQSLEVYPCKGDCLNYPGSYTCNCPQGTYGDARYGCTREKMPKMVILASVLLALFVTVLTICLYGIFEKRKRFKLARQVYQQNGGTILEAHLSTREHIQNRFKIFTKEELEKATNKFDDRLVLGQGGQGKVYKGILPGGTNIAIKKPVQIDDIKKGDFINEIIILTEINHPNVVKLIGCCLELDIPFLVYEFLPNETLWHHINRRQLSWEKRLRIAAGAAGALAHLHVHAPKPICHQDVKSANILLSTDYTAKISDFGISKLVSTDARAISTFVEGTIGYLDPEYIVTRELTGKSDVFSFGVVLAELLTGRLADSAGKTTPLAKLFKSSVEENKVLDILDPQIAEEATDAAIADMLHVADLAGQCLNLNGKDRPDMMVVFIKLEGLWRSGYHQSVQDERAQETDSLPANQIPYVQSEENSMLTDNTTFHSVNAFGIGFGR